jgi:uncharacterized RDD family membrane protein YckC
MTPNPWLQRTVTSGLRRRSLLLNHIVRDHEPLLTTYACRLGQAVMRIRVRTAGNLTRIGLDQAFGRLIVKYLLGIISLLTVPARRDRRAIRDLSSGTIVIEARGSDL